MPEITHEDDLLAAEYVLGTLRDSQRDEFEARMQNDEQLAQSVEQWQQQLMPLSETVGEIQPHQRVWQRFEDQIDPSRDEKQESWWQRLWLWQATAFASIALLVAILVQPKLLPNAPDPAAIQQANLPVYHMVMRDQQQQPLWVMTCDWRKRSMQITPVNPVQVADNKSLELWMLGDNNSAPISLGLVAQADQAIALPKDIAWRKTSGFAISLEPLGGSPNGSPTEVLYSVAVPKV